MIDSLNRRFGRRGVIGCTWLCVVACCTAAHCQIPPSSVVVRLDEWTTGLGGPDQLAPTDLAILPDGSGRLAIATLGGRVRLIDSQGSFLDTRQSPYLDALSLIGGGAYGTTGLAFHPDFGVPEAPGYGKFYSIVAEPPSGPVDLTAPGGSSNHRDVLVEWTVNDPASDSPAATRRDVLRLGQPHQDHNVSDLAFDDSRLLYISSGDGGGGSRDNGQDLSNHHGSLLRIDPLEPGLTNLTGVTPSASGRYSFPNDNPFAGDGDPDTLPEIYAYGFRSPYRFTFDDATGRIFLGDVGAGSREEVDLVEIGHNYGWPIKEGSLGGMDPRFTDPLFEYGRDEGETVVGGFIYRGAEVPGLTGQYIFADFGRQVTAGQAPTPARLFAGDPDTGQIEELRIDTTGELLAERDESGALVSRQFIFSIGADAAGELYLLVGDDPQFPAATNPDGRILRITAPPVLGIPGDVNLDGVVSGDGTGPIESDDVSALIRGWRTTGHPDARSQIMHGDLNLDGTTDWLDWHILRTNHPGGSNLSLGAAGGPVPEPSTVAMLAAVLTILVTHLHGARRRGRQT